MIMTETGEEKRRDGTKLSCESLSNNSRYLQKPTENCHQAKSRVGVNEGKIGKEIDSKTERRKDGKR